MDKQRVIEIVVAAGGIRNEHNYIKPHIMICEDKLPEIAAQILLEAAKPAQIFGGQAMNTGQINADYHLYKRQLDEAKKRIAELEQALHPIANSYTDCEITDRPAWWILCPSQNMKKSAHETYASFFGPFWSRESATKYLDGRRHRFADNAIVYCGSCNDSPELKNLFDLSKAIGEQG